MTNQELLDNIEIGLSPLTNRIYIGLPDKKRPNTFRCKSDFTDRFYDFAPFLEPTDLTDDEIEENMRLERGWE